MQTILGAGGSIGTELAKALKLFTEDIRLVGRHPKKVNETDLMLLDQMKTGAIKAIIARAPDFYGIDINKSILMSLIYKNLANGKKAQWMFNAKVKHSFGITTLIVLSLKSILNTALPNMKLE
jgi:hypothetical protein